MKTSWCISMNSYKNIIKIKRCDMSANETTLDPSHNL